MAHDKVCRERSETLILVSEPDRYNKASDKQVDSVENKDKIKQDAVKPVVGPNAMAADRIEQDDRSGRPGSSGDAPMGVGDKGGPDTITVLCLQSTV